MKYDKLMQDVLKCIMKEKVHKKDNHRFAFSSTAMIDGSNVHVVTIDGYACYVVPNYLWVIDDSKIPSHEHDFSKILSNHGVLLEDNHILTTNDDGYTYKELVHGKERIYVDYKLLNKYIDPDYQYKFYNLGGLKPVFIYEYDHFVGFIMPVRIGDNK